MPTEQCPICFSSLEAREVAPCMDCGHDPLELQHFKEGMHTYAEYRLFDSLSLILCDFCQVDFGSYDPTYFGLPPRTSIGFEKMTFIRDYNPPSTTFDKVCKECQHRLGFLEFVAAVREIN